MGNSIRLWDAVCGARGTDCASAASRGALARVGDGHNSRATSMHATANYQHSNIQDVQICHMKRKILYQVPEIAIASYSS